MKIKFPWLALAIIFAVGMLVMLPFILTPELDIKISALYFVTPGGFYLEFDPLVRGIYRSVYFGGRILMIIYLLMLIYYAATRKFFSWARPIVITYLAVALTAGPWLGVHYGIKENFDRPRPREIVEFGGTKQFTPPLTQSEQGGNSFSSGHASMMFYFVAFALLTHGWKRVAIYAFSLAAGIGIGLIRIIQGGHFATDVVASGIFTLMVVHLCYALFYTRLNPAR